ncbi:LTA synthase family protein [Oceanobacillus profundus]|uniref:LTA synthase family protein n=1 Tax=Oceanobacillus profundus TaxID=372463 RepID=A0A417YIP7_9BACI|nr:LTA synthase family protein [Oceanobacillus profundus]MBR3119560.1 LTA synthase family protein [Oceanobacillus sp.]MCM3398454.1 LTA synthase family protein [Oceanobacillus profundus]PAE30873.1 phosphoglycerol transferase [Paenibacillus sp. 7884-2]RHW32928.1 LTA synthase family protein [Oceanobacillus profundus]
MRKIKILLSNHIIASAIIFLWLKTVLVMVFGFSLSFISWLDIILLFVSPIGTLMLFIGFSFLFSKKVHPLGLMVIYILITGLLYANLLYYRFYIDFVTVSVLLQLNNVGGLGASTLELFSPFDILLFIDIFVVAFVLFSKRKKQINMPNKRKYGLASIGIIVLTVIIGMMQNQYLFKTAYDREGLVQSLGLYNYQVVNMIFGAMAPIEKAFSDEVDANTVSSYLKKEERKQTELFGIAEGKNVIMISMESTQNFVVNEKVNGEEITPFLNDLIQDSFYFSNIYDQTAQGKTSDAEFMIDTGLYPLPSGSVFVRRPKNEFESLPNILQEYSGYKAYTFHGNDAGFWNRKQMYDNFGYEHFFAKENYDVTEENSINYGIKDIAFFEQSMEDLISLPEPYLAKFITLTNHFPFLLEEEDQLIELAETGVDVVNRYVATVRYQDRALERFFEMVKEEGLYENTIFVIFGDHYGISKKYEAGVHELLGQDNTPLNHLELQQIPVVIHVPGQQGETIEANGGEIDIRATLLHLLGVPTENRLSFSRDLFTRAADMPVVFRNGDMIAESYAFTNNVCYERDSKKKVSNKNCSSYLKTAREELEQSDNIIFGDLFRFIPHAGEES